MQYSIRKFNSMIDGNIKNERKLIIKDKFIIMLI